LIPIVAVLGISVCLATSDTTSGIVGAHTSIWLVAMMISTGPLSGWFLALQSAALPSALELLLPSTILCALPVAYWLRTRSTVTLWLASAPWVASGYLFSVAIWV
jgi:hypothetical protein